MSESIETNDVQAPGAFLPILLIELSLITLFAFLCVDQSNQRSKIEAAVKQRESAVQQSALVQAKLQKLIEDFNAAAPEEAKAVFAKYGIQFGKPAEAKPSPTP